MQVIVYDSCDSQSGSLLCLYARSPGDHGGQNGQTNSHSDWVGRNVLLCSGHDSGHGISGKMVAFLNMENIYKMEKTINRYRVSAFVIRL